MVERRENLHQTNLSSHLGSSSQAIQQGGQALSDQLLHWGTTSADGGPAALGVIFNQLVRESTFLAFMDCFRLLAWLTFLMIPLVFLIKKFRVGGEIPAGH